MTVITAIEAPSFDVAGATITGLACFADREETAGAGGALIVPAREEFTLVARRASAEAVCIMTVGGQAVANGAAFTPPWAE